MSSCNPSLVLIALLVSALKSYGAENPKVKTTSGTVEGTTLPEAHAFFSIPYAVPPVGNKRFEPPEALSTPNKDVDATQYKAIRCSQILPGCLSKKCYEKMSEDCLVLSVFVPTAVDLSSSPTDHRPVMIWIHGGALQYGSGTHPMYDPRSLSKVTGNIAVVINYRLGPFGFLVYGNSIKGNQGIKDQQLAMKWVQENIKNFGGDKNKVTLFGYSAGAQSIALHLLSPVSKPLFARAILQSNAPGITYPTTKQSKTTTEMILKALNCSGEGDDELTCLRKVSTYDFVATHQKVVKQAIPLGDRYTQHQLYRPVIDGYEFKDQIINSFRDGRWNNDKDLIMGVTSQEYDMSQYTLPWMNETSFKAMIRQLYGSSTGDKISSKYIKHFLPPSKDYRILHGMILTHGTFTCPARALARFASDSTDRNVYFYISAHPLKLKEFLSTFGINSNDSIAFHGSELPFVMRSGKTAGIEFSKDDYLVANAFNTYWGSFAKTANTSSGLEHSLGSFPEWPQYLFPFWDKLIIEAPQPTISDSILDPVDEICDFWDSLNLYSSATPTDNNMLETDELVNEFLFFLALGELLP